MTDVFISYERSTQATARRVAEALRGLGYEVWIDDELPAHRPYADVIEERVRAARSVVVIWSADATKSEWVRSEASVARKARKLVQLRVDGTRLPMPFDQIQCADLSGWNGEVEATGWRQVLSSVAALVAAPAAVPAPPAPSAQPPAPPAQPGAPLLAVLAFDNLSGDPDTGYFSDGVSEEILHTVGKAAGLKVIGRGSSFQFRGSDKNARHVARELNASHVLDGSVRRSGNRVRISAQLVECAGATSLWSERFDRDLSDIFTLQDEIAASVAEALRVVFAPTGASERVDPDAYDLYLKTRAMRMEGGPEDIGGKSTQALETIERVVTAAPDFAKAWAELAILRTIRAQIAGRSRSPDGDLQGEQRAAALAAAHTALRLDPKLGYAYVVLAAQAPYASYREREALIDTALTVSPNDPEVLTDASKFSYAVGRFREASQRALQALTLDPLHWPAAHWHAVTLQAMARYRESTVVFDELLERHPDVDYIWGDALAHAAYAQDWERLETLIAAATRRGKDTPRFMRGVRYFRDEREPSPQFLDRLRRDLRDGVERTGTAALNIVAAAYGFGFPEEAFAAVNRSSFAYLFDRNGARPGFNLGHVFHERYRPFQSDPRFVALCARLGLVDYWIASTRWPDCADDGVLPYDFKAECRRPSAVDGDGTDMRRGGG
jgi:adenylate cyclase